MKKRLIRAYNHRDTLLVVSLYPKKGELYSSGTSGLASYAKNIVTHMRHRVVVLADKSGKKEEIYEEKGVLVLRCFERNNPFLWFQILKKLLLFSSAKNILIQFDFAVFGGNIPTFSVIFFLGVLKLLGRQVSVVMHHVVLDAFKLKGHIGLKDNFAGRIKGNLYNVIFHLFYRLAGRLSDKTVVLEDALRQNLGKIVDENKILTIPHGVDTEIQNPEKEESRKKLRIGKDEYVVMFFGYINWFKGADFFVEAFGNVQKVLNKKTRFILAGGESPTMIDRPHYRDYYGKIMDNAGRSHKVEVTGYIPQKDLATYFSAADLIVLPYRHFMTASGVLSLVFSYRKPFIISEELKSMFDSDDFRQALEMSGLKISDMVFALDSKSCLSTAENVLVNGLKGKMTKMAGIIREKRSYRNTAMIFDSIISPHDHFSLHKPQTLGYTQN